MAEVLTIKTKVGRKTVVMSYFSMTQSKKAALISSLIDQHFTAKDFEKKIIITVRERMVALKH